MNQAASGQCEPSDRQASQLEQVQRRTQENINRLQSQATHFDSILQTLRGTRPEEASTDKGPLIAEVKRSRIEAMNCLQNDVADLLGRLQRNLDELTELI